MTSCKESHPVVKSLTLTMRTDSLLHFLLNLLTARVLIQPQNNPAQKFSFFKVQM